MDRRRFLQLAIAVPTVSTAARVFAQGRPKPAPARVPATPPKGAPWMQWGGPHRNFQTEASGLRDTWPASGPRVIWKRPLGEGYSSVIAEGAVIYTMYGKRGQETVLAAHADTGATVWEHTTPMTFQSDAAQEMGNGPYATPLLSNQRLFTTGVAGRLQCLDRSSGKMIWTQQLWDDHGGSRMMYGYASSPIAYRDTVIVPVGGRGKSVMAFHQASGKVVWARHDFGNVYSSPILIDVDGLEQLVALMDGSLVGLNPVNGDLQWQIPFKADYSIAVATPLWMPGHLLFVSSEYNGGAKVIALQRQSEQVNAKELWASNRLRLHNGNAMCIDDTIYFTSGGKGSPAILTAADVRSGEIRWQERSIGKATFVRADGKLVVLEQSGTLMIARPSPSGFNISARAQLLTSLAWTPPTLVGTRLYLRDRRDMMAVDLG
jgi:outer membrane protein assembly factor BamB